MSIKILGWILILLSMALLAPLLRPALSSRARSERTGETRVALASRLFSSRLALRQRLKGSAGTLMLATAVFLFVAGAGVASSYMGGSREPDSSEETDGDVLARLETYARSIGTEKPQRAAAASADLLPDVSTMIERLAARLKGAPQDVQGWRMLGWSYFNTGNYQQAAAAYAKAVELDPSSVEIKRAYEDAKAKAAGGGGSKEASAEPDAKKVQASDAMPAHARE